MVSEEYYQEHDPNLILVRKDRRGLVFDEFKLLKVNFLLQSVGSGSQNGWSGGNYGLLELSYEQKIKESPFSISADLTYHGSILNRYPFQGRSGYFFSTQLAENEWESEFNQINFQLNFGVKYYYNQKRRLKKGIGGNNLNGAYVSLLFWNGISQVTRTTERHGVLNSKYVLFRETEQERLSINPSNVLINWGIQTRILKRAYLDFNIGPTIDLAKPENWAIILNLKLGVALWRK